MRLSGKVEKWHDEKGFGFISSGQGNTQYFFHIKSFRGGKQRPSVGLDVSFETATDNQGRSRAENVVPVVEMKPLGHATKAFIISASFLLAVGGLYVLGFIPLILVWLYLGASTVAFLLHALDKRSAKNGKRRTPEMTLHNIALIGGWPGALFAQQLLRHKSKKASFRATFWVTVFINICALVYLLSPYGSWALQALGKLHILD